MTEEKCMWCGQNYGQHEDERPNRPVPKMPCLGLKSGFRGKLKEKLKDIANDAGNALGEAFENR